MRIGVPRETRPGETRVAATPRTVEQIVALGYAVFVEQGAGAASSFDDAAYVRAGADVIDEAVWNADVLLKINAPSEAEIALLRPGQVVVVAAGAGAEPRPRGIARGSGRDRPGDGCRAADLAGPVAGRAVVDGQHRWVPRGGRGGPRVRVVLHRAGDRGGEGARRRRCWWSEPASPGWRRSARHPRWVRWCARSTPAPRSASRWSRWARSSCASTSRRPGRRPTGTRGRPAPTSTPRRRSCTPRRRRTSTS